VSLSVIAAELWVFRWIINRMPVLAPSVELVQDERALERRTRTRIA
jgi:hypothetical protein